MNSRIVRSENTFFTGEGYWLEGHHFDDQRLVVTFENAEGGALRRDGYRNGWSSAFLRKHAISHLCVKPLRRDWYQGPGLAKAFSVFKADGFFDRYKSVMTYGSSMGGFGALIYADYIGADKVLAFNPQSAMSRKVVPFESRWLSIQRSHQWDGPFADAKGKSEHAKEVILTADMRHWQDREHVRRILSHNSRIINVPYLGHGTPAWLATMGLLSHFVLQIIKDEKLDEVALYRGQRQRRKYPAYYQQLLSKRRVQKSELLKAIVTRARNNLIASKA